MEVILDLKAPSTKPSTAQQHQSLPQESNYLMLGLPSSRLETHLIQAKITQPPTNDAEFFLFLRQQYEIHRRRWHGISHFWKRVSGIYFVRFCTENPSSSHEHMRVIGVDSLPDADDAGWTRKSNRAPPPGPETMLSYLNYPKRHERSRRMFSQVPRKLDTAIPSRADEVGWGLYYFERTRWDALDTIIIGLWAAASLAFGWLVLGNMTPRGGRVLEMKGEGERCSMVCLDWRFPAVFVFYDFGILFSMLWGSVAGWRRMRLVLPKWAYSSSDE
jgi:hypothetical protein